MKFKIVKTGLSINGELLAIRVEDEDGCLYEGVLKKKEGGLLAA